MDLLSYRGPGAAGGVSSALQAVWSDPRGRTGRWWFFDDAGLRFSLEPGALSLMAPINKDVIRAHYRFCNEFLWPLMHGLTDECVFRPDDFMKYTQLQQCVVEVIDPRVDDLFVNDYHFAMIPSMVSSSATVFWHIPWPDTVEPMWRPLVRELATSILQAETIGFHCSSYAENYLSFLEPSVRNLAERRVIVAPIGLDAEMWQCRAIEAQDRDVREFLPFSGDYILSVDRVDYAKGTLQRLNAIDGFFEANPHMIGRIRFVQLSSRSRSGIDGYDKYWTQCRHRELMINQRWQTRNWQPVVWIEDPLEPADLAVLYANARALLITSLKDGLNLTAKEFAMCQSLNQGTLILSAETGVWQELKDFAITIDPNSERSIIKGIEASLEMPEAERHWRSVGMRRVVESNALLDWFRRLEIQPARGPAEVLPLFTAAKGKTC